MDVLCGLQGENDSISKFRCENHGKKVVLLIKDKKKILKELELLSINRATLFPEIESVSEYIKDKCQYINLR